MKKILVGIICSMSSLFAFEPPVKEKDRGTSSYSSSDSGSGSKGQKSFLENIELHRKDSPQLNTARLEQEGKIVVKNLDELARILNERGIQLVNATQKEEKRASIIYMPEVPALNLGAITRDISNQKKASTTPDLEKGSSNQSNQSEPDFEKMFDFYLMYLREHKDMDICQIKKRMINKFKKAHNSPPPSPQASPKEIKRENAKKVVRVLHDASCYHETARTKRTEDIQRSPQLTSARPPKALEVLNALVKDPEVNKGLDELESIAYRLLSEKLTDTKSAKLRSEIVGGVVSVVGTVASAVITYLVTKDKNNDC
ncbi:MAG: hypothetical protein AMXMBFR12_10220 [Candidatus Babeliales bacterium]